MAHFETINDSDDYLERYCLTCLHGQGHNCPVWQIHLLWNGALDEAPQKQAILDSFIPREGQANLQCVMYVEAEE